MTDTRLSNKKERVRVSPLARSTLIFSALVFSLAACSSSTESPALHSETDPYDIYRADDLQTIDAAQKLELYKCLAAEGFPQLLEGDPDPEGADASEGLDAPDDLWFASEEQARENGFGHPEPGRSAKFRLADPAYINLIDSCMESAWKSLGEDAEKTMVDYAVIGNKLRVEGYTHIDEKMTEFRDRVFECLQEEEAPVSQQEGSEWGLAFNFAIGSLEGQKNESSDELQFGFSDAIPERSYIPTPEESEVAVQVYNCAIDTGVKEEAMALAYQDRNDVISEVEVELTELNTKISEMSKKAAALRGQ